MEKKTNKILLLVVGAISLLLLGSIYAWSIFVKPLEAEFGWTRAQTSLTYTISMSCMFIGMMLAGVISKKFSAKVTAYTGIIMIAAGFLGCRFIGSLYMLYICYGVLVSGGVGLCYNTWLPSAMAWFPENSGLVSGIMLAGFGMGGLILGTSMSALLNSSFGWRNTFLLLAVLLTVEQVFASTILLKPAPVAAKKAVEGRKYELGPKEMMTDLTFYVFTIWKVGLSSMAQSIIGQASLIASDVGASVSLAALAVGILSVGNGCGRTIAGFLHDKFGTVKLMFFISSALTVASLIVKTGYASSSTGLIIAGYIVVGLGYGSLALMTSAFINKTYGFKNYKTNYGINSLTSILGTLITPYIGIIKTNTGSYQSFFSIMVVVCAITLIAPVFMPKLINNLYHKADLRESKG